MSILTLDDLVTPEGLAPFLEAFATKTSWHLSATRAAQSQTLLPWPTIEGLVANALVPADRFRVVINGNELPQATYSDERGRLRADAVQRFAMQGATLVVNDIGALVPDIGELTTAMERDLRCTVNVNCYVTFGALSAFRAHHDRHDVLALQIHGAKIWRRFGSPISFPIEKHPVVGTPEPVWEGLMTPGDLLYLPRGEIHAAIPEARPSVHLTFGLFEATGIDFLQWLETKVKDVEILRRDLGAILTGKARAARDQEFFAAMRDLIDKATVADFFDDQDRARSLRPLAALGAGQGGANQFLPDTQLISALRRRLDLAADQKGEVLLMFGKSTVRLSQLARRALVEITRHHRITVAALASSLGRETGDRDLAACLEDLAGRSLVATLPETPA